MKTFDGYSKEKFSDTSVLLAGGGSKELSNFIGTLNWDSTNRKLQYKKIGDTNWRDLVTFGSNATNSTAYLPLAGGTMTGDLTVTGINFQDIDGSKPVLKIGSPNKDTTIWRVYSNDLTYGLNSSIYGYSLKYLGTGNRNNNKLVLIADNQTGARVTAVSITQDGVVTLSKTPTVNGTAVALNGHTHSQYVDLTSVQTISGIKTFSSQINSSVATGTSPFSVSSTTLVSNLNADLLDGIHESSFYRYREEATGSNLTTLWSSLGAKSYPSVGAPDGLTTRKKYYWGAVWSFPANAMRLELWANCYSTASNSTNYTNYGDGIYYRTGWSGPENKQSWLELLDSKNYTAYINSTNFPVLGYTVYHTGNKPTKTDVGLGNVDNTADADKTVLYAKGIIGQLYTTGTTINDLNSITAPRSGIFFSNYKAAVTNAPASITGDGELITIAWGSGTIYNSQIAVGADKEAIAFRWCNSARSWGSWRRILHSNNYSSYALPLSGGTCTGDIYAPHFYESSDIRYKKILRNLSIKSNTIANLPLFDFEWIENNSIGTGTSAQAVQEILPNLVSGTDKLTLDYGVLGTIAGITACKELVNQKSEIDLLKERIKELEQQLKNN